MRRNPSDRLGNRFVMRLCPICEPGFRCGAKAGTARRRKTRAVAMVVVSVLLGAGCSAASDSVGAAACGTPGFSADTVKIGFVYPDSGVLAKALGSARSGVDARIAEANAAGGVHGRRLALDWRDDVGDPASNAQVSRDLVAHSGVFGLLEATTAASGGAQYLAGEQVPVVGLPAENVWTEKPNMFAPVYLTSAGPSVDTFGRYVAAQGGTKAVIIGNDLDAAATGISAKLKESLAAAGVQLIPGTFLYNHTVPDLVGLARKIRDSGADAAVGAISGQGWADILGSMGAARSQLKVVLGATGYTRALLDQSGRALAGVSIFLNYVPFEAHTSGHQRYLEAIARYAPEMTSADDEIALLSYVVADMFVAGLQAAGPCPTRKSFMTALSGLKGYDAGGILPGPINLAQGNQKVGLCYSFVRVNQQGNGFDIVPPPNATRPSQTQWCGSAL